MKRAVYDKQFKMAAVKLAQETDKSVAQTAAELGISGIEIYDENPNCKSQYRVQ